LIAWFLLLLAREMLYTLTYLVNELEKKTNMAENDRQIFGVTFRVDPGMVDQ